MSGMFVYETEFSFMIAVRNVLYAYSIFWKRRTYDKVFYYSVRVSSNLACRSPLIRLAIVREGEISISKPLPVVVLRVITVEQKKLYFIQVVAGRIAVNNTASCQQAL